MFEFFKKLVGQNAEPVRTPTKRSRKSRRPTEYDPGEPSALPEVVEGNDHTDWALWQESVNSQLQPVSRSAADSRFQNSGQSQFQSTISDYDELDPFSSVKKNRDV
jgi:hypothetical protein